MKSHSITPILTTNRLAETRHFYVDLLGFTLCHEHPCYLGVRAGGSGSPELGFMTPDAESPHSFAGRGLVFAFTVDSADREHARLRELGVHIVQEIGDRPWGSRSFLVEDPNGVQVAISHPLLMAPELATGWR